MDELLIFLPRGRTFSPADAEKELISVFAQFVKLVVSDIIKAGFFEAFQNGVRGKNEELIPGGHQKSLQG
jgi:hypothetical protein